MTEDKTPKHIDRDYDDQSIVYRIADLLEEILEVLRKLEKPRQ